MLVAQAQLTRTRREFFEALRRFLGTASIPEEIKREEVASSLSAIDQINRLRDA